MPPGAKKRKAAKKKQQQQQEASSTQTNLIPTNHGEVIIPLLSTYPSLLLFYYCLSVCLSVSQLFNLTTRLGNLSCLLRMSLFSLCIYRSFKVWIFIAVLTDPNKWVSIFYSVSYSFCMSDS